MRVESGSHFVEGREIIACGTTPVLHGGSLSAARRLGMYLPAASIIYGSSPGERYEHEPAQDHGAGRVKSRNCLMGRIIVVSLAKPAKNIHNGS